MDHIGSLISTGGKKTLHLKPFHGKKNIYKEDLVLSNIDSTLVKCKKKNKDTGVKGLKYV